MIIKVKIYTVGGVISNHYRYRAIGELKCPILNYADPKPSIINKCQGI